MQYRRILLKLSGEALSGGKGFGFDEETVLGVARQIKAAHDEGIEIGIVIGGGNFWRGRSSGDMDRVKADQIGMLATVMNCLYAADAFRRVGLETAVFTPYAVGLYTEIFNKDKAIAALKAGKVVFYAGGTGHPFFSTDMATSLRALETDCDCILMAKSVDGVYDDDPAKNPNAKKFDTMTYQQILEKNLKVIDLAAAALCAENRINTVLFALKEQGSIQRVVHGEKIGTTITNG